MIAVINQEFIAILLDFVGIWTSFHEKSDKRYTDKNLKIYPLKNFKTQENNQETFAIAWFWGLIITISLNW